PAGQSLGNFTQAIRSIGEPILGLPVNEISIGRLLGQLFAITETFGMQTQPHLLLLQKVLVVSEGVGRVLYPEANMWQLARPLIEDWVIAHTGPDARLKVAVEESSLFLRRLPRLAGRAEVALDKLIDWEPPRRSARGLSTLALGAAFVTGIVATLVVLALL
ncbi:MAG: 2-polyprenylphenol 6-hydroxylase, partial [Alphaproteobacteria bacterium]